MKKKKIAFFSTSISEFGNMSKLIKLLKKDTRFQVFLFVGGAHLLKEFGNTIDEIKNNNIKIDRKISFFSKKNTTNDISSQLATAQKKISSIFKNFDFDYVVLFGDRYELLPIITNIILYKKKLIHFGGGEITKGAIDNKIRDIVSRCASLHFTSSEEYKRNLVKLGEDKKNIYNAGTLSISPIKKITRNKIKIENFNPNKKFIILTFHSITMSTLNKNIKILNNIFLALDKVDYNVIITSPNKEIYSEKIILNIKKQVKLNKKYFYVPSLGNNLFKFLLKKSEFIIGNSSACVISAPFFKIPSINIGDRQEGRILHNSVINSNGEIKSLIESIKELKSNKFKKKLKKTTFKLYKKNQFFFIKRKLIKFFKQYD